MHEKYNTIPVFESRDASLGYYTSNLKYPTYLCPDSGSPFQKKQHNAPTCYKQIRILIEPMLHGEFFTKKPI